MARIGPGPGGGGGGSGGIDDTDDDSSSSSSDDDDDFGRSGGGAVDGDPNTGGGSSDSTSSGGSSSPGPGGRNRRSDPAPEPEPDPAPGLVDDTMDTGAGGSGGETTASDPAEDQTTAADPRDDSTTAADSADVGVGSGPTPDQADTAFTRETLGDLATGFSENVAKPFGRATAKATPVALVDQAIPGSPVTNTVSNFNRAVVESVNPAAIATGTIAGGQRIATDADRVVSGEGGEVVDDAQTDIRGIGAAAVGAAKADPVGFGASLAGGAVGGVLTGSAAGRGVGKAGRFTSDRVRTAGGTKIDVEELANDDVIKNTRTDGAEGDRFPGAADPDQYESDPAQAVRDQADEYTPDEVDDLFDEQGVEEGTTLTKALDTEPEGPASGRSDTGFTSAPAESLDDFEYETPGSFFGPELSPNFLRAGGAESSTSLRPGLPDFGNRPTAVMARTEVENADADDLQGFNEEMIDRAGDTTAVTKPADEVNPGEIEAVVPPGAEFSPVGSGGVRGVARRFGVGSDFYTEVNGRRVPIRTVAPTDRTPDAPDSLDDVGRIDGPDAGDGAPLDSYVRPVSDPADRVIPVSGGAGIRSSSDSMDGDGGSRPPSSGGGGSGDSLRLVPGGGSGVGGSDGPGGSPPTSSGGGGPSDIRPPTSPGGPTGGGSGGPSGGGGGGSPSGSGSPTDPLRRPIGGGDDADGPNRYEFEFGEANAARDGVGLSTAGVGATFENPTQSLDEVDDALEDDLGGGFNGP